MTQRRVSLKKKRAYRRYCRMRYYFILIIYTLVHFVQIGYATYTFKNVWLWSVSCVALTLYQFTKWYQLKNTKFRRRGYDV